MRMGMQARLDMHRMAAPMIERWWLCILTGLMLSTGLEATEGGTMPLWIPMPLLTPEQQAAGVSPGGEGSQWPRGPIAVSPADPDFLLLPIDVGGVYRSRDAGRHWEIAMVGWNARGANGFAIDPRNATRAIGIAANSMNWDKGWGASPHGLYLTTDQAASWRQRLALPGGFGGELAYDPTSFAAEKGWCATVYYLSNDDGLLLSRDGGETWSRVPGAPSLGVHTAGDWSEGKQTAPHMALDPATGAVYLGGEKGLCRTTDHGQTWTTLRTSAVFSLAVTSRSSVLISDPSHILSSSDAGSTWVPLAAAGIDASLGRRIQGLAVSPIDPLRMLCWTSGASFAWPRYVSLDGGATFRAVAIERDGAALPLNGREGYAVWSARDADIAWSIGGDWVVKSADAGRSFRWSNNGYNGIMTGSTFNFSAADPDTVFIGFQDYNGAFTRDGGRTWNYRDVSGKGWGGHEYAGFALDKQVMWSLDGESWSSPRTLRLSRDGGTTWTTITDAANHALIVTGRETSCGDPGDGRVGFAGSLRTGDGGSSWTVMTGCDGVFTADPGGRRLYGVHGGDVIVSMDHGRTWANPMHCEGGITDLAYDQRHDLVYAASQDRLKVLGHGTWSDIATPADQYGNVRVTTVAIDPQDPSVIYVGGPRNTYASQATVCRSVDGGATWTNLTITEPLRDGHPGGPHEVSLIRVHPRTHEAWVAGQCFGLWRISAPTPGTGGRPAAMASAPRSLGIPSP
jgi:photosystem II stability/assembly factor-like uncharacterized protein